MKKIFVLLAIILLWTGLNAQESKGIGDSVDSLPNTFNMKLPIKAKAKDEVVEAKVIFKYPLSTSNNMEFNFISHITAKVKNKIVFDCSCSSYLVRYPMIFHTFRNFTQGDTIEYFIEDNEKNYEKHIAEIKKKKVDIKATSSSNSIGVGSVIDFRKANPKIWKMKDIESVINELYGSYKTHTGIIELCSGILSTKTWGMQIRVKSKEKLESIAILSNSNSRATIAIMNVSEDEIVDYTFRIKTEQSGEVVVIAKGKDGKLYKTTHNIIVDGMHYEEDPSMDQYSCHY